MTAQDLSRRTVLGAAGGAAVAATALSAVQPARATPSENGPGRPNIVWFLSEDNNPYLGAYGDPVADTPALDRLAAEGARYDVMYSPAPVCAPSRFTYLTGMHAESCGPAHHMRAIAKMPVEFRGFPEYLRDNGYYATNNAKTDYNANVDLAATWDESSTTAHWRNRPAGVPFFAQFTDFTTHESQVFGAVDGATDPAAVKVPAFLPDTATVRADHAHYYDLMHTMDTHVAERLAELEADGVLDDTIIFYFGDNGGVLPFSKRFAGERGNRVPLIIWFGRNFRHLAPGRPGVTVDAPVAGVDLPPTALHLTGTTIPQHFQGRPFLGRGARRRLHTFGQRSRMDERYDLQRVIRDDRFLYLRNYLPHRPYGQSMGYMWQQKSYQEWEQLHLEGALSLVQERFWDPKPFEELYALDTDRDCVVNLVDSRRHRGTLQRLRRALDAHLLETHDNGFIPESHPAEGYTQSRTGNAYPIERILELASIAASADVENLPLLRRRLTDRNDIVRFWAAQGLLILGPDAAPAVPDLRKALSQDDSVYVKIPVAEALARLGHPTKAAAFLADTVDNGAGVRIKLQALNALTCIGTAALPHKAVVDRAANSTDEYLKNAGRYLKFVLEGTYTPQTPIYVA